MGTLMSENATWRVYLPEWLTVYTSDASGSLDGGLDCLSWFRRSYSGRVRLEDHRVVPAAAAAEMDSYRPYCLQLRLPNLKGEFKDRNQAADLLQAMGGTDGLVRCGSPQEQALLDYGRKMLPAGENGGKGQ